MVMMGSADEWEKLVLWRGLEAEFDVLTRTAGSICRKKGWKKDWLHGGCYMHLETSEFIEALRGKGGKPEDEAADVLMALLSTMSHNGITGTAVMKSLRRVMEKLSDDSSDLSKKAREHSPD